LAAHDALADALPTGQTRSAILVHLSAHPGGSAEALRQVLGLSQPATVRAVDRLVRDGVGFLCGPLLAGQLDQRMAFMVAAALLAAAGALVMSAPHAEQGDSPTGPDRTSTTARLPAPSFAEAPRTNRPKGAGRRP